MNGCSVFRKQSYSRLDTKPTVLQIRAHNRGFKKLCG